MKKAILVFVGMMQLQSVSAMCGRAAMRIAQASAIPVIAVSVLYAREEIRHRFFATRTEYDVTNGDISEHDAQETVQEYIRKATLYNDLDQQTTDLVRSGGREYTFEDEKYADVCTPLFVAYTQLLYSALWLKRECSAQEKELFVSSLCSGGYSHEQAQEIVSHIKVGKDIQNWSGWYEASIDRIYFPESTIVELQKNNPRALWILFHEVQHYQYSLGHDIRCVMKDTHFEESRAEIETMYRFARAREVSVLRTLSTTGNINRGYVSGSHHIRAIIADQIEREQKRA